MRLCLRRQVCLLGGAAQSGPMADAWRLQLAAAPYGCGFAGAWRPAQPLDGGRSWQSASLVSTAEVSSMLVFLCLCAPAPEKLPPRVQLGAWR